MEEYKIYIDADNFINNQNKINDLREALNSDDYRLHHKLHYMAVGSYIMPEIPGRAMAVILPAVRLFKLIVEHILQLIYESDKEKLSVK